MRGATGPPYHPRVMKWLTRSIIPSMVALAALVSFLPRSGPSIRVSLRDFKFKPVALRVHEGDSVLVTNRGKSTHTLTCPECGVDTRNVAPGLAATVKFTKPGIFTYYCIYHRDQGMTGRVTVVGKDGAEPTPAPSPAFSPVP